MKRALVTGGAGFLGSHIADALSDRGVEVVILDRNPPPYIRPDQRCVTGDILDEKVVARAMDGVDTVFHLAGFADLNKAYSRPRDTARLNLMGTLGILEAALDAGARRVLFASTVYVYSRAGGFYRCSKQACESYIEEFQRQFGLEYTVLRYGSLYGPRADETNGVYRLLKQAVTSGVIRHGGLPEESREYVHVEDAARLSVDAAAPEFANQHLVVTGQYPMRASELFTMFSEIIGTDLQVEYANAGTAERNGHYIVTPYAYSPRVGKKIASNQYVDMGQGILQLLDQIHSDLAGPDAFPTEHDADGTPGQTDT